MVWTSNVMRQMPRFMLIDIIILRIDDTCCKVMPIILVSDTTRENEYHFMISIMNFVHGWNFITHGTFSDQKWRNAIAVFSSNSYQNHVAERSLGTRYHFLFCFDRYRDHVDICHVWLNKGPGTKFYEVE